MTERTIRSLAVELAGQFYDFVCSSEEKVHLRFAGGSLNNIDPKAFRDTFPKLKDYLAGTRHGTLTHKKDGSVFVKQDGRITPDTPGWMYFYDMARQQLTNMLGRSDISEHMKQSIFAALQEDRQKQFELDEKKLKSLAIPQRKIIQ